MGALSVIIISRDTAAALGIKYLLNEFFSIEATVAADTLSYSDIESNQQSLYFVESDIFAARHDFFIPRRSRTIIISHGDFPGNDLQILNTHLDESSIIETLRRIITTHTQNNDCTQNDLSQREIDVLRLVAMGYINKEIADRLEISINTVLSHRKNITTKLGIRSVSGLGFYAMMHGYVTDSDIRR